MSYNYSIIIPHYSKDGNIALLHRAVNSIPKREDIQIIVIDNSNVPISIDEDLINENITILYSDNKKGAGGARNVGLQSALGKWLLFLDADDYFVENAFVTIDKYLCSNNDIVFFKPTSNIDNGQLIGRHVSYATMIDDFLASGNSLNLKLYHCVPWSKMIRKSLVEKNNISFDEVPASNDVIFSLMTGLYASNVFADSNVIYCVTANEGSIINTESFRNLESRFKVAIKKNDILKSFGYKANVSLIYYVIKSIKYGLGTFVKFMYIALSSGYFFVGWKRWGKTLRKLK